MILCLVIFVLTIASFLWGKISMGLTALLSMVLLVLTGCIDITTALSGFSNSNTIIMACMFIISAGFSKTQMVAKLSRGVAKAAKGSFTRVLTGYIIVTFLIAQIVPSAMAVFSIVFPLALGVCDLAVVGVVMLMLSVFLETPALPGTAKVWAAALFLGIVCSGVCLVIQSVYQKHTTASRASLIFTLEPVFSAIFAFFLLGERIGIKGYIGSALMLASLVLVEVDVGALFGKNKKKAD